VRVTIEQVAKRAGVSEATVSRVANRVGYVKDIKRQSVETAMAELGYVPNRLAKNLVAGSTKTIGLVITSLQSPFFVKATEGIQEVLREKGYHLLLCNTKFDKEIELANLQLLREGLLDGIITTAGTQTKPEMLELTRQNYPIVFINRLYDELNGEENRSGYVRADLIYSGRTATEYLLGLGHRHFGILSGAHHSTANYLRLEGHFQAIQVYNLERKFTNTQHVAYPFENGMSDGVWGYSETMELLQTHPEITALLYFYHPMLPGVLRALRELGRTVPDSLSLIGFDDFPLAPYLDPPLTLIAQPVYEMGKAAARLLLQIIENNPNRTIEPIILKPELIIRRSCTTPKG
jgi:DNA-binding LacI/PurR family transcriptional regulator